MNKGVTKKFADPDMRLYILMRNDLQSMNPGKAMAQAAHAANQLVHEDGQKYAVKYWQYQSGRGFGTTIVLSASEAQIHEAMEEASTKSNGGNMVYSKGLVYDDTYPYIVTPEIAKLIPAETHTAPPIYKPDQVVLFRKELTCAYMLRHAPYSLETMARLPLHP